MTSWSKLHWKGFENGGRVTSAVDRKTTLIFLNFNYSNKKMEVVAGYWLLYTGLLHIVKSLAITSCTPPLTAKIIYRSLINISHFSSLLGVYNTFWL